MPRTAREHIEGSILHIVTRGVNRQNIFEADLERKVFLGWAQEAFVRHDVRLLSYCLMSNHIHLLVAVGRVPVGRAMHDLLTRYSLLFNARYERVGHLFQNRFNARAVRDLRYLINTAAYIHLNPVRASLAGRPEDWEWSGHRELVQGHSAKLDLRDLLSLTGLTTLEFQEAYLERIESLMGEENISGASLRDVIARAALSVGLEPMDLFENAKGEVFTIAKKRAIKWAQSLGFSLADIAREMGCSKSAVAKMAAEAST